MPLYEYECRKCGKRLEKIQKVNDLPLAECPFYGGELHRLLGVPALQFKGSGWYVTDYGKGHGRDSGRDGSEGAPEPANDKTPAAAKTEATATGAGKGDT